MKKIFAEIGFGNDSFFSTEIEDGDSEYRVPEFIKPQKIDDYYICLWLFKKVFIFSIKDGFKMTRKDRNKFKILFGIGGNSEISQQK